MFIDGCVFFVFVVSFVLLVVCRSFGCRLLYSCRCCGRVWLLIIVVCLSFFVP